jgi:hypothetical protein
MVSEPGQMRGLSGTVDAFYGNEQARHVDRYRLS